MHTKVVVCYKVMALLLERHEATLKRFNNPCPSLLDVLTKIGDREALQLEEGMGLWLGLGL